MRILYFCFIAFFPLTLTANCQDPMTQTEMNVCAGETYQAADKELNRVYKIIVKILEDGERKKLLHAQRAWLKYRDANCEHQNFNHEGGTIYPALHDHCLADVTKARTTELKHIYPNLFADKTLVSNSASQLIGDWQTQGSNELTISFTEEAGKRVFRSHLHQRPFETGQWQLLDGQLLLTAPSGELLRLYNQVQFDQQTLRLSEQDGTQEVFVRIK